jgi:tetratricopeptide (TPR) repeat protein
MLGSSAYVLRKWHRSRRAEQGLILGNKAYQEHRWEEAANQLGRYVGLVQDDVPALLKYADAQLHIRPLNQNNLSQAVSAYRIALRAEPDNLEAAARLSEIYLQMSMPSEAELITSRCLADVESTELKRLLAMSLIGQRKIRQAAQELTNLINENPEQVLAYEMLGQLAEQQPEDFSESAEYWFDKAIETNPSSALAYIARGSFNLRRANTTEAKADFAKAETLDLSEPQTRLRLAGEFLKMNDLEKAEQHLTVLQKSSPDNQTLWQIWAELAMKSSSQAKMQQVAQNGLEALASQPWDFMPVATELFIRADRFELAAEYIEKLRQKEIAPSSTVYLDGLLAEKKGRAYEAVNLWRQAIQMGNKSLNLRMKLSLALWRLGDRQSAINELRTIISQSPDFIEARLNLAQMLAQIGNWQDSAEQAKLALRRSAGNLNAALLLVQARIYLLAENQTEKDSPLWDELKNSLKTFEKTTGDSLEVKLLQFNLTMKQGDLDEADTLLASIKQSYPESLRTFLAEADLLTSQNKEAQAVSVLNEAIERFPDEVEPVRNLATLLAQNDKIEQSEQVIKDATEKNNDQTARRTLSLMLAEFYDRWGQREKAYQTLSSIAEKYPGDIPIKRRLLNYKQITKNTEMAQQVVDDIKSLEGENGWQWKYEQVKLWFNQADFERYSPKAVSLLKENLLDNPDDQPSRMLLAAVYEKSGRLPLAISFYQEALNRSPRDLQIVISIINALYKANEYDRADEILRQAADENLFHPELQKFELYSHMRRGELTPAGNVLKDMLEKDPNNLSISLSLALLKIRQNSFADAVNILDELEKQEPNYMPITAARIELNLRQNNNARAVQFCDDLVNTRKDVSAYLLRGRVYTRLGQIEKAQTDFDKACSLEPNNISVWVAKSDFHNAAGNRDEAVSCIHRALAIQPDNPDVYKRAILLLLSSGNHEMVNEGKKILENSLASYPDDIQLRIYKARQLLTDGTALSIHHARDILQEITQEQPKLSEPWRLLGTIAIEHGQLAEAIDIALQGLTQRPNNKSLLMIKARAESMRSPTLAVPTLKAMLEQDPNDFDVAVFLADIYADAEQATKAVDLLENCLAKCDSDSQRRKIDLAMATALYRAGRKADAQSRFDSLYRSDPADPKVLLVQAKLLRQDSLWDQLDQKVADWCRNNPRDNHTSLLIANDLAEDNSDDARRLAEKLLRNILAENPQEPAAMNKLAILLQATGRNTEAADLYQQILKLQPDNTIVLNNLAWILCQEQGKYEQALEFAQMGLELDPDYVDLIDTRGVIYYELARYEDAVRDFTRCLELYPDTTPAKVATQMHLAKALIKLGRRSEAQTYLKQALELYTQVGGLSDSEHTEAASLLEEISEGV